MERALIILLILYVVICLIIYFFQHYFFFRPEILPRHFTYKFPFPFEELDFKMEDGGSVNAIHLKFLKAVASSIISKAIVGASKVGVSLPKIFWAMVTIF